MFHDILIYLYPKTQLAEPPEEKVYTLVNWLGMHFSVFLRRMMQQNANDPTLFKWLQHSDINYNKCSKVPSYF